MDIEDIKKRMQALQQDYESSLPARIALVRKGWEACMESGDFSSDALAEIRFVIHKLAGSGTTFGFSVISEIAERVEMLLGIIAASSEMPSQIQKDQIRAQLVALSAYKHMQLAKNRRSELPVDEDSSKKEGPSVAGQKLLYIVDDDVEFVRLLSLELEKLGFESCVFVSASDFEKAYSVYKPEAVLMDMGFKEGNYEGAEVTRKINTGEDRLVPVIFISVNDSFEARLKAVRAGATHYFKKPLDIKLLGRTLEGVTYSAPAEPYRVLIVDDDKELASIYQTSLESDGMEVVVVNDPVRSFESLDKFRPDLILMDVQMPECNGIELATIIRQYHEYDLTPIVFLTTEWRKDFRLASINLGSDDFLSKPISPWYLVESLKARIKRARILRAGTEKIKQF